MSQQMVMISHPDYTSDSVVLHYRPLEWQRQGLQKTRTGYGTKIPTTNVIALAGRIRRVYIDIYSNSGHTYVMVKGEKITVR